MRKYKIIGLLVLLGACSNSGSAGSAGSLGNLNPFNWFRGGAEQPTAVATSLAPARGYGFVTETRPLIDQLTALNIEKTTTGAIVRATALAPTQGYHRAELVVVASPRADQLTLHLRAQPPATQTVIGAPHLRQIVVGFALTSAQVRAISRITVVAERNSRTARP